jgi:type II secretory ATPase GspE/PulE/Tfp pilus assembly ATPase PilB-like protein
MQPGEVINDGSSSLDQAWLGNLVNEAINRRASDIHIDSGRQLATIRFRIDGMLQELDSYDLDLHPAVVSQIKISADLDIVNTRLPQDGQFEHVQDGRTHYVRVSTFPSIYGEAVVMRILNHQKSFLPLDQLGLDERQLKDLYAIITSPFGMVLATGPSGSGKSTLLNSILSHLNSPHNNIVTVEDPVEFHIDGVRQTQVNQYHSFDFATALRAILRQDPDIMMIGEIRDAETARIAVQATMAGRLFFSTFHTLDLAAIVSRFIEMEIPRSVVAHVLGGIISARLVRKTCPHCREPYTMEPHERALLDAHIPAGTTLYHGIGCEQCDHSGYFGTIGIYEVIRFDNEIRSAILDNANSQDLRQLLREKGVMSLFESALSKAIEGITSPTEVIRVTGAKAD